MLTYINSEIELVFFAEELKKKYPNPSKDEQIVISIIDKMLFDLLKEDEENDNKFSLKKFKTKHFDPEFVGEEENSIKRYELNLYSDKEPFLVIDFFWHQDYAVLSIFHSFEESEDQPWNLFFSKK